MSEERPETCTHFVPLGAPGLETASVVQPARLGEGLGPNALVRWAFYLSVFSIPFTRLYLPGTGERVGVLRVVQLLLLVAVLSQPRICLRRFPVALAWLGGYCLLRIASGLWLSPELSRGWWPSTVDWVEFSLPWVWMLFNLLPYPGMARRGLWALVWGCALCASLHLAGVGVTAVDDSLEQVRTTVFGENANVVGTTYAVGLIILVGLGMFKEVKLSRRLLLFSLIALIGVAMAKTASRTALIMVGLGILLLLFQARSFASRARRYSTLILISTVLAAVVWQVPTVMERFRDIDPQDVSHDNPRARMVPVLWDIFLRSPIYGSGPDAYRVEMTRRAMPYFFRQQQIIAAHNLVLLLLVETGVIGLLVFGIGLWKVLAAAWRCRVMPCGFLPLALFLPFFISGLVLSNPTSAYVFWLAVAYALAGRA